jgi:tetratricopeptide (TPR) repeat protein
MFHDSFYRLRFQLSQMLDERRPLDGLLGLPALFSLILLGFIVFHASGGMTSAETERLEKTANLQLENQRFVEARILAKRLAQEPSQSQRATLIEANALRSMGKVNEAARLLARIAPLDQPGHAPAHVVQAATLLTQEKPDAAAALRHIDHALNADPSNQDALELAARFAAGQKQWRVVLKYLDRMETAKRADLLLMKATALQLAGMPDDSIQCASEAEVKLREMQSTAAGGSDRIRYSIAVSLSLQRRFEEAIQGILAASGTALNKEDRQLIGGIYLSWSRHLKDQPAADKMQVLELLEKGIQISPESQDIIMAFLTDCEDLNITPDERRHLVERVLGDGGTATSFLHYYLGVQDWKQGLRDSARAHFELACSLNPGFKVISNNLAMAIASSSDRQDDLEKALTMMDDLVKQEPENTHFLDTRGHVLARLGRVKDAISDFERALPKAPTKASTHAKLAELYQQIGMSEMASEHRTAAVTPSEKATAILK